MFGSAFILAGAWEGGVEILYQIFGPGLLGSWAVGNLCKSEIAQKAISLHDLAGAKSAKNGRGFSGQQFPCMFKVDFVFKISEFSLVTHFIENDRKQIFSVFVCMI